MSGYETELQKYIYDTLCSDSEMQSLIGGSGSDKRVYYAWRRAEEPKVSKDKPYLVVQVFDYPVSKRHGNTKEIQERIAVHCYTTREERMKRREILNKLRELFDNDVLVETTSYRMALKENANQGTLTERGLFKTTHFVKASYMGG